MIKECRSPDGYPVLIPFGVRSRVRVIPTLILDPAEAVVPAHVKVTCLCQFHSVQLFASPVISAPESSQRRRVLYQTISEDMMAAPTTINFTESDSREL